MNLSKGCIIGAAIGGVCLLLAIIVVVYVMGCSNKEARLRNTIVGKQKDNTNEYDATWKEISQCAQVTDAQKTALMEIIIGNANARKDDSKNLLAKSVKEAVPNVDVSVYTKLMNIITSKRDGFVMRQKELVQLKVEHDTMIDTVPGGWVLAILGRQKIDITIVTSTRTENAFKTGKDDDTDVFQKSGPAETPKK